MAINKLIVTNTSALIKKYGNAGVAKIKKALKQMAVADAARGLTSKTIAIDSKSNMAKYGAPVSTAANAPEAKAAVDAIYKKEKPEYILILGASDIVPLVKLKNPVYSPNPDDDNDTSVPSDLPYACDTAYSTDINHFVGPTRVVGRLPDLIGAKDPQYLIKLLQTAANYKPRNPSDYQQYFGLSAKVWNDSTKLSLSNLFGKSAGMKTAPSSGPSWSGIQLAPLVHFINCHGGDKDIHYYGQPPGKDVYPHAHEADLLPDKIVPGTVMAAECCYGAQLYNPSLTAGQPGIAYTYLGEGAYGVFGSTTIAYGSSSSNSSADLICQYFVQSVMAGASLGRAALEARHQFAGQYSHLSPTDLKTLAQFYLLGDPSIHAASIVPHGLNSTKAFQAAFAKSMDSGPRILRRERLDRVGTGLQTNLPSTRSTRPGTGIAPSREITRVLTEAASESGLRQHTSMHFHVAPKARESFTNRRKRTIHMLIGSTNRKKNQTGPVKRIVAIIATAENGKLMHLRRVHSR